MRGRVIYKDLYGTDLMKFNSNMYRIKRTVSRNMKQLSLRCFVSRKENRGFSRITIQ